MRGNFVSPIGNPYYEPDYEKYYYDPPWYDWLQDPETYHELNQFSRSAARAVGPLLPLVAGAAPLGAVYYTIRENYNKLQADRLEAIRKAAEQAYYAKMTDIRLDLKRANENIKQAEKIRLSRENTPHINTSTITAPKLSPARPQSNKRDPTPPMYNIFDDVEEAIERKTMVPSPQRSPIIRPTIHKLNIPLNAPIRKNPSTGLTVGKQKKHATKVMNRIQEVGDINRVINDPEIRREYPDIVNILEDIPGTLTGPNQYPEPLLELLDETTQQAYRERRDEAKEIAKAVDRQRRAEEKKPPWQKKK